VGKVFKPDLRKRAIRRIYDQAVEAQGVSVVDVVEDRRLGLVAILARPEGIDEAEIARVLGGFTVPWRWAEPVT
jgi:fatty-acyl-CoA synthase